MAFSKHQPTSIFSVLQESLVSEKEEVQGYGAEIFQKTLAITLTYGPNHNELSTTIPFNEGTAIWDVYLLQQISSDIILMYGSFYSQMYRKARTRNRSRHVPRDVKDQLLKENFPVHKIRNR